MRGGGSRQSQLLCFKVKRGTADNIQLDALQFTCTLRQGRSGCCPEFKSVTPPQRLRFAQSAIYIQMYTRKLVKKITALYHKLRVTKGRRFVSDLEQNS